MISIPNNKLEADYRKVLQKLDKLEKGYADLAGNQHQVKKLDNQTKKSKITDIGLQKQKNLAN